MTPHQKEFAKKTFRQFNPETGKFQVVKRRPKTPEEKREFVFSHQGRSPSFKGYIPSADDIFKKTLTND